jgi:DNA-binding NtrC family response regulator
MEPRRILVVDDDADTRDFLREVLSEQGWEVLEASTPGAALDAARDADLVLSDIRLESSASGIDVLRRVKAERPETAVILMTGFGTLEAAVEAVREGAFDFVSKPFNVTELITTVRRALQSRDADGDDVDLVAIVDGYASSGLVGRSRQMISLYKEIAQVAPSRSTVLVTGESGTGKELVARAIHAHSPRVARPFVAVNCGALTETLLEAELFGHQRGSFTGAVGDKKGLFEEADGGTIFLDEIGETSPALQVKLLRALQEGEIRRVGGTGPIRVDVRVIAATNRDLEDEVKKGAFREDLFYRLSVVTLRVPALRERVEDIPLLVAHFLKRSSDKLGREANLSDDALTLLTHYAWPGNVRELENTMEYLVLHCRDRRITSEDLPAKFQSAVRRARPAPALNELYADMPSLDEFEKRYILHVLRAVKGNRTRAAEVLAIDRRTLYRMAERFGIDLDDTSPAE